MRLLRHVTLLARAIPPQITPLHLVIVPVISKRGLYLGTHSVDGNVVGLSLVRVVLIPGPYLPGFTQTRPRPCSEGSQRRT